jgi:hypothetical protein
VKDMHVQWNISASQLQPESTKSSAT